MKEIYLINLSSPGTAHFQHAFPAAHNYGILNNNCQTFVYFIAKLLCPDSPLLIGLPGLAPHVLRLLSLPPGIHFLGSLLSIMTVIRGTHRLLMLIAGVYLYEETQFQVLTLAYFFVALYAISSILNRRTDCFMSSYSKRSSIALDRIDWSSPSTFLASQNFASTPVLNRSFLWNEAEVVVIIATLMGATLYTIFAPFSSDMKRYYSLLSASDMMVLALSFMGPYSLFANVVSVLALVIPTIAILFGALTELAQAGFGGISNSDFWILLLIHSIYLPLLFISNFILVFEIFKYKVFNVE